ncbi:hypothetical protein K0M31_003169 [Melipona bicolor]|uniref:Uncharacterized protein n=1 Tax=Melipona bicolor TaxID=60889 RepID=A0AA40KP75_9HYME|nr:hypothetical protein K0M31_003169 [Melipona bicolor]
MSVLSMLALRMITQTGPAGCMKIHRALNRSSSVASNEQEQQQVERSSTETQPKLSKSAKRRLRRKKLGDSRWRRLPSTERESPQPEPGHRNQARETGGDDPFATDLRVYRLVTHEERRTARDFFERSLMAAFLLKCLQRVGFFEVATKDGGRWT